MAATKRAVDFSNVKDGGNFRPKRRPEGDYKLKIVKVDDHTSQAGNEGWVFTLVVPGDSRASYPYYCEAEKNQWKLRNLFIAAGVPVPKKRVMADPNKLVNKMVGATLVDDEYEGKIKSVIDDVFPADDVTDSPVDDGRTDDDDEAPATRKSTKKTKKQQPVDDDDDDLDEIDLEEI